MHKLALFLLITFASAHAAGCGCTEVGCRDGIAFTLVAAVSSYQHDFPVTAHLCAGATCADLTLHLDDHGNPTCDAAPPLENCAIGDGGDVTVLLTTDDGDAGDTTITVEDSGGATLFSDALHVDTTSNSPNGPLCGPTCHGGEATFTPVSK